MKCPYCAEEIKDDALKCRYCGEWIVKKNLLKDATGFLKDLKEKYEERKAEKFRSKISFPVESNPLIIPKGIIIKTDSIRYQDHHYNYDMVMHVRFFWKKTYINGIPSGSEIRLNLSMKGFKDQVTINANTLALESRKVMDIYSAFLYVSHMSFPFRYKNYAEFINKNGYFEYDGIKFYVDGTIERKGTKYNIRNGQLLKSPFQLDFVIKPGKLFDKKIVINTHWDADVFYELLKRLYGIAWS